MLIMSKQALCECYLKILSTSQQQELVARGFDSHNNLSVHISLSKCPGARHSALNLLIRAMLLLAILMCTTDRNNLRLMIDGGIITWLI